MALFLHLLILIAPFCVKVSASCAYGTSDFPRQERMAVSAFGYDALQGPLNWYGLNETENSLCDMGKRQSPIVLNATVPIMNGSSLNISIEDYPKGAEFENIGTSLEVFVNGTLNVNSKIFKLAQFHFHTPSEHRLTGEYYPMEVHFVFQSSGELRAKI